MAKHDGSMTINAGGRILTAQGGFDTPEETPVSRAVHHCPQERETFIEGRITGYSGKPLALWPMPVLVELKSGRKLAVTIESKPGGGFRAALRPLAGQGA